MGDRCSSDALGRDGTDGTVGELLRQRGLVGKKRRIRRSSPYGDRLGGYDEPNAVWCADFKGHFPVAGFRCHPLTITDGFSRFLLRCKGLERPLCNPASVIFESAFREFGLPDAIRTDNGAPFSTLEPGGLSRLAVWWIRLGIRPERILPGRPDQNGQRTPASIHRASLRPYSSRLPELEYPAHFDILRAYPNGVISFRTVQWYVSGCLDSELIGLDQVDDDRWKVYFGPIVLGMIDLRLANERGSRQFATLVRFDGEIADHRLRRRRFYPR